MRRYSGSGHGFGALPPITSGLVFFGDLTNPSTSVISGAVATYADSSGNGRNFTQGTALNRPNYTAQDATFGDRPSMTFGGATQFLQLVAGFPAMANVTMYAVTRSITVDATPRRLLEVAPLGVAGGLSFLVPASTHVLRSRFDSAAGFSSARDVTATMSAANRWCSVGALTAGGALWTTYLGGSATGTDAGTAAGAGVSSAVAATYIGSIGGVSNYFYGTVTDILVYNTAHTAAQVAQVDAWLKWRNRL